jgi:hypothetical protein
MARAASEKVGQGPCPSCGEPVWFRKSTGGMLSHRCEACDSSGYADPRGSAYAARMASMTKAEPKTPEPAPAPAPRRAPQPARASSAFNLGQL